jgi:cytochrome c
MADQGQSSRALRSGWGAPLTAAMTGLMTQASLLTAAPDIELGRHLAGQCMTCHRAATDTTTIPNIFGMAEPHFTVAMKAYREKQLPNPVMQTIAARLNDEEIQALAAYFARTRRPGRGTQ